MTANNFATTATTYDRARRQLIPCFDRFYGTTVELLDTIGRPLRRVLDLGAGTGILTEMVAQRHPDASFVLIDEVPEMLELARVRLDGADAEFVLTSFSESIPAGPFDAVVSALAIHHLPDSEKEQLMHRISSVLTPGGIFVNAEQAAAATPSLDALQSTSWRRSVIAAGLTAPDLAAADLRMAADICATVDQQLAWLRASGFVDVDAPFRDGRFAVITGRR